MFRTVVGKNPAAGRWCALLAIALLASCGRVPGPSETVLTSASQVRELSAARIQSGVRVRLRGILTYSDGVTSDCFVQDSTGGIRVSLASGQIPPPNGWRVEVDGVASYGGSAPAMVEARISAIGADALPPPIPASPANLHDRSYEYKRVLLSGVVQSVSSERPGLVNIAMRAGKATILANVPASWTVVNDAWIDEDVVASGVLAESWDAGTGEADATLWISDPSAIQTKSLGRPPAALPVTKIGEVLALGPARAPAHRVRLRGMRYAPAHGGLAVGDSDGQIAVRLEQAALDANTATLDVAGFLVWERGHPVLDQAVQVPAAEGGDPEHAPAAGSMFTTALPGTPVAGDRRATRNTRFVCTPW